MNEPERDDAGSVDRPPPVVKLPYMPPAEDLEQLRARRRQLVGGVLSACGILLPSIAMLIGSTLNFSPAATRPTPVSAGPFVLGLTLIGMLAAVTLFQHFVRSRAAFTIGVLIGVGVSLLIEGLCFLMLVR